MAEPPQPSAPPGSINESSLSMAETPPSRIRRLGTSAEVTNTLIPSPRATPTFETLPPEVRNEIYRLVLVVTTRRQRFNIGGRLLKSNKDRVTAEAPAEVAGGDELDAEDTDKNNTMDDIEAVGGDYGEKSTYGKGLCGLLYVNKQVSSEASHV